MSTSKIIITTFVSITLFVQAFSQTVTYPFQVEQSGKGKQAIIFIPGFACSGEVWNETKALFESNYVCYTLTMAGFAGVQPKENPSFRNWETAIADYIKASKIEKPVIIGHSMGGGLALAIAADYPELVGKIVVVDALPCLSALMNPGFESNKNNDCSAIVSQIKAMKEAQFYQMQKRGIQSLLADTAVQEKVVSWGVQSDRQTFAEMYCDFLNTDLREKIKNIACPSLVLLEPGFKNIQSTIEGQYKNVKGADIQFANNGLHFIMYDDSQWYFTQLNKFLTGK